MSGKIMPNFWATLTDGISSSIGSEFVDETKFVPKDTGPIIIELREFRQAKTKTDHRARRSFGTRLLWTAQGIMVDLIAGLGAHAPLYVDYSVLKSCK
jgi:hypothetical protein